MSLSTEDRYRGAGSRAWTARLSNLIRLSYKRQLLLLLAPYLLGLALLVFLPALLSIPFAFTNFDALSPPRWVGLDNFEEMSGDRLFWNGLWVSLFYIVVAPARARRAL